MQRARYPMFAAAAAGLALPVFAQDAPPPGSTAPGPATVAAAAGTDRAVSPTPIVVRAVKGRVQYRASADQPRKDAKVGDVLTEGTEITTTLNSAIELQVGAGQVFTVDRLTRMLVREAIATEGKEKTTVAVPYGRVQFEVSSATVANDVQIQAPDATLAVKGTIGGIEVSPGFPTLAFGGDVNRGVFDVAFEREITTTFRGAEKADAKLPDTAAFYNEQGFVNVTDLWTHEGDEHYTIRDYQTILFLLLEVILRDLLPEAPFDIFFLDENTLNLYRADVFGTGALIGNTTGATAGQGSGLALVFPNTRRGAPTIFRLEDNGGPVLLSLDLGNSLRQFQFVSAITSNGPLSGLGALGTDLYSIETGSTSDRIVRIDLGGEGLSAFTVPAMDLGIRFDGSLSGITLAGNLILTGRLPTIPGYSNGMPGVLGPNAAVLTVDPRINYLSGAATDLTADLAITPQTQVQPGLVVNSVQRVTGVSVVVSPIGQLLLVVTTRATVNGQANRTVLNIFTIDDDGQTTLALVGQSAFVINALAAESRATPPPPDVLADAPPSSQVDQFVPMLFAELAYSQDGVDSGVVERLIANQIVLTADDPTGCAASSELRFDLLGFIVGHVDQRSGAGASIFDFRNGLVPGHPCLPPGFTPGADPLTTGFLYLDELTGDLHARTLAGNDVTLRLGEGQLKPILGAAITPGPNSGRSLFTLSLERDADDRDFPVLSRTDVTAAGATAPQVVDSFGRRDIGGGIFRSWDLAGLGGIGSRLFTTGTQLDEDSSSGGAFQSLPTIYELDPVQSAGTPMERMVLPMDFQPGALAGAPTRGSLFALGSIPGMPSPAGSFQLAGSGANAVLFEVDPRNNYMAAAYSAQDGDFASMAGTSNGGVDPTTLTRVTGMAHVGSTLVMTAIDQNGQQVLVQYSPGAANTPSDPRLRRLDRVPTGFGRFNELASENIMGPIPGPRSLADPTSPIDTTTINARFAQMAYGAQAAASSGLRSLVAEHIAATSADPAGCRASAELNGPSLPGFLNQHVNQRAGVGQTVFRFRNGLAPNHPCRPGGGPG